ncbi:MAG: hypothetical protein NTV62_01260 [Candidatus Gribaldobacteria bacterium]|nr:hypothetical protein [Candidatus Gribaldobacteria bacterium]
MKPLSWDNITWDDNTKDDEPGKAVSWKGLEISYDTWTQCVDGKTYRNTNGSNPQGCTNIGEKACDLYANLHKTPMGALDTVYPCDKNPDGTYPCKSLAETLNSRIEDLIDQYDTHCDKDIADCKKYKPEAECTKDKLGCKSFKEYINSPIQELVFGGLISRFAKGNIKQMVCGEVLDQDFGITIDVDNPAKKTLAQYCQTIKLVPTQLTGAVKIIQNSREKTKAQRAKELQKQGFGFFPVIDKEKFTVKTTADQIKQAACYFNYYACQNPLVSFNRQLGNTTAEMLALSCSIVEARVKIGQQGLTCVNWDKPDFTKTQLGKDWQPYCQTCDLMEKHNGAYLMIRTAIEAYYSNKPKDEVEEINTYEWICAGLPDWCNDAKLVAQERKIDVSKMEPYTSLIGIPSNVDAAGKTVLAMFTTPNKTIDDVLIDIPFGVIKPFKTGEASLLRGKGQGSTKNFLSRTPYEFLHNDVCGKIVLDFKDQHPKYTFESLKSGELKKLPKDALPYSVESLAEVTTADVFKALADLNVEAVDIEPEELIAYSTCLSLDYSPAQLMGLDQTMEHYIYPPEFRILFDLINKNSKPEQLPEILNQLFRFIYRDTPASTLSKIGTELATRNQLGIFSINFTYWTPKAKKSDPRFRAGDVSKELEPIITSQNVKKEGEAQLETPATPTLKDAQEIDKKAGGDGKVIAVWQVKDTDYQIWEKALTADAYLYADTGTGEAIKSLASFLGSTIGSHIPNNKKLVSYIVDNKTLVCPKTELLCGKDWQKLFASKTLLNLIADNFEGELFDSDLLKKITDPKYSVMGLLSNRYTWLKTPYLDLLFNTIPKSWQQATAKQYYNASTRYKNYIENPINKAVSAFQSKVQEGFDKALVEAPNWLWDKISELWTKKVGQNFGDNTSGTCRKVVTDSACDTTNLKEIYRETVQPDGSKVMECCSGGQPLVCEPQCRVKPAKENCLFEKGEIEIKDKGQCCYKGLTGRKEDECRQCRLANAREEYTKTCPDKSKPVEVKDAFGGVKFACCIKRASSDVYVNGVATGEKKCCVSVTDCITNQFVDNLSILAEMIAKNAVPVSSLTGLPLSK